MAIFSFLRNQNGATAIEYAIIASLLSIVIMGAVLAVGQNSSDNYTDVANKVDDAMSGSSTP